jgi:hypothetical protein
MSRSGLIALLLATVALAGCGEKPEPSAPAVVTGTLSLEPAAPAAPDAGTTAGHKAGVSATTRHTRFAFTGRVKPPSARVELTPPRGRSAIVKTGSGGGFRAEVRKLRRGRNRFVLKGTAAGLRPWTVAVAVTRK